MPLHKTKIEEETHYKIMRILEENPDLTQRELARKADLSLGGLNYCLNALINEGFVKMANFQKSKNKFNYVYLLTPKGITEKLSITRRFLGRKLEMYEALKSEIESLKSELPIGIQDGIAQESDPNPRPGTP